MSGKFMKVKKIFIPTLTAILMVSQLTGCAAVSQSEMLTMINNQQAICIEVAVPISQEDGEEKDLNWIELAFLETYPEFRLQFEDTLGITAFGDKGKNGTVYVDLEGNQTNNSTLYYAMMNKKFRDQLSDTETNRALLDLGKSNYADVEGDAVAKLAYINAYFNIFNDADPSYFNGNSTLTRAEFLSGLYRAENPVTELTEDLDFTAKVDPNGESEHTIFAQQMLDKSYLNFDEKSLNEMTFNGEITRAEAIYTLVKTYYSTEFDAVTGKESCFSDAKNGGNIAEKQKFIETDKKTKETTYKDYWKSYELQYAIDNPDKGLPTDLYKALVVAQQKGLITGSECRWDEAITKGEALNFIVKIYESMPTITNADRGTAVGESLGNSNEGDGIFENPFANYTKNDESLAGYEVEITETLDTRLYVVKPQDIKRLDNEKAGNIAPAELGAYLTVTGKTSNGWYEVKWGNSKGYLPADALSKDNPTPAEDPNEVYGDNGMTAQEITDKFNEAMGNFDADSALGGGLPDDMEYFVTPDYDKLPW